MQEYCLLLKILLYFFSSSYQINRLKYESLMSKFAHKVSINTQKKTAALTGKNGGFFGKYRYSVITSDHTGVIISLYKQDCLVVTLLAMTH